MTDQTSDIVQRAWQALRAVEYAGDDGAMCPCCGAKADCAHRHPCGHYRALAQLRAALDRLEALETEVEEVETCANCGLPIPEERTVCQRCSIPENRRRRPTRPRPERHRLTIDAELLSDSPAHVTLGDLRGLSQNLIEAMAAHLDNGCLPALRPWLLDQHGRVADLVDGLGGRVDS